VFWAELRDQEDKKHKYADFLDLAGVFGILVNCIIKEATIRRKQVRPVPVIYLVVWRNKESAFASLGRHTLSQAAGVENDPQNIKILKSRFCMK
jgi:hypothetical protein